MSRQKKNMKLPWTVRNWTTCNFVEMLTLMLLMNRYSCAKTLHITVRHTVCTLWGRDVHEPTQRPDSLLLLHILWLRYSQIFLLIIIGNFNTHLSFSNFLGNGLFEQQKCTKTSDTVCDVLTGYFCKSLEDTGCTLAEEHSSCKPGQRVKKNGKKR